MNYFIDKDRQLCRLKSDGEIVPVVLPLADNEVVTFQSIHVNDFSLFALDDYGNVWRQRRSPLNDMERDQRSFHKINNLTRTKKIITIDNNQCCFINENNEVLKSSSIKDFLVENRGLIVGWLITLMNLLKQIFSESRKFHNVYPVSRMKLPPNLSGDKIKDMMGTVHDLYILDYDGNLWYGFRTNQSNNAVEWQIIHQSVEDIISPMYAEYYAICLSMCNGERILDFSKYRYGMMEENEPPSCDFLYLCRKDMKFYYNITEITDEDFEDEDEKDNAFLFNLTTVKNIVDVKNQGGYIVVLLANGEILLRKVSSVKDVTRGFISSCGASARRIANSDFHIETVRVKSSSNR